MKSSKKLLRLTQLSVIQMVRKPLPPAVRVFKDKKYKRDKKIVIDT